MSYLQEISLSLLLGSDRNPLRMPDLPGAAGEILAQMQVPPDENALLTAAGLLAIYEQAGISASRSDTESPEPCAEETGLVWNTASANLLFQSLLDYDLEILLSECFRLLAARQLIAPLSLLPRLLTVGIEKPNLRSDVRRIMGKRGAWLAQMNPEWSLILTTGQNTGISVWEQGSLAERVRFLEILRQSNPAEARELLIQAFPNEPAQNRSAFLEVLRYGLSGNDESFLSSALKDRSREVIRTAAKLLSLIPDSELARKVKQIMRQSVSTQKKLFKQKLTVEPPEQYSDELKQFGIIADMKFGSKIGTRAGLLLQLTALTPLDWWEKEIFPDAAACISSARKSDWKEALMLGWVQAAVNQGNSDWAMALSETMKEARESLTAVLSDEHFEHLSDKAFRSFIEQLQTVVHLILPEAIRRGKPLSAALSEILIKGLRKAVRGKSGSNIWELRNQFRPVACLIHPSVLEQAAEGWYGESEYRNYFQEAGTAFSEIIRLRKKLYEELGS